jgi:hypothetical protein
MRVSGQKCHLSSPPVQCNRQKTARAGGWQDGRLAEAVPIVAKEVRISGSEQVNGLAQNILNSNSQRYCACTVVDRFMTAQRIDVEAMTTTGRHTREYACWIPEIHGQYVDARAG